MKGYSNTAPRAKAWCQAISKAKKGHKMSLETRQRMSETRREKYQSGQLVHPMKVHFHLTKELVEKALKEHNGQAKAAMALGVSQMTISRAKRKFKIGHDGRDNNKQTRGKGDWVDGRYMRSSWEVAFANKLNEVGIKWQYEPERFILSNGKSYRPDFWINRFGYFVEIKGHWYPKAKEKFEMFCLEFPDKRISVIEEQIWTLPLSDFLNILSIKLGCPK